MTTIDTQQRSPEWFEARRGMPTASRFDKILTPVEGKPAKAQETLINELIAESVLPPQEGLVQSYVSEDMRQGMILEAEARCAYELEFAKEPVTQVGFCIHPSGLFGGSPDALVGKTGGVEIKCPKAETHIGYIRDSVLPSLYRCQIHGYMLITGRDHWDFFSYSRHFQPFHLRVMGDDFTVKLEAELMKFCERYNRERVKFGLQPITNLAK